MKLMVEVGVITRLGLNGLNCIVFVQLYWQFTNFIIFISKMVIVHMSFKIIQVTTFFLTENMYFSSWSEGDAVEVYMPYISKEVT